MLDVDDVDPGGDPVEGPVTRLRHLCTEGAGVRQLRDRLGQGRVHPPRRLEEVAELGRDDLGVLPEEPAERRGVDRIGVRALAHLRELLRVPQEHQVVRRDRAGERLRRRELPGLVDDEEVQLTPTDDVLVRHRPRRTADDVAPAPVTEVRGEACEVRGPGPRQDVRVGPVTRLPSRVVGELIARDAGLGARAQDVGDRRVPLRGDTDPPAVGDEPGDDPGGDVRLARAGRALDREVGVVEVRQGRHEGVDVPSVTVLDGSEPVPRPRPRRDPAQQVDTRRPRQIRPRPRDLVPDLPQRGVDALRRDEVPRDEAGGQDVVLRAALLQRLLEEDHVVPVLVGRPDDDGRWLAGVEVPGAALGARRVDAGVHRAALRAVARRARPEGTALEPQHPPWQAPCARPRPVGDDLHPLRDEDPGVVGPLVLGRGEPFEVRPPERLVLAAMELLRGGDHRQGLLLGAPLMGRHVAEEAAQPGLDRDRIGPGSGVGLARRASVVHLVPRVGRVLGVREQPVPQPEGRDAVVLVVIGDPLQLLRGPLTRPGDERIEVLLILDDGLGAAGDALVVPQLVTHVERLELLDAVRGAPDPDGRLDRRVEVDEDPGPQQVVELLLALAVPHGQPLERGGLVGGVVVDVHPRVAAPELDHVPEEVAQRLPLSGAVVRPQGREARLLRPVLDVDETPEVFQPPHVAARLGPHRVALEVEEEVPGARRRKSTEVGRGEDLVREDPVVGGLSGDLEAGLRGQPSQPLGPDPGHRLDPHGEVVDGRDPRLMQRGPGPGAHPGDEHEVPLALRRRRARVAAAAGEHPGRTPGDRVLALTVGGGQLLGMPTPSPRDGQHLPRGHLARRPRPQDEPEPVGHRYVERPEDVRVRTDLQERGDVLAPGELGVGDDPAA